MSDHGEMEIGWKQPSHPGLIHVSRGAGRGSGAVSLVSLPPGALFAKMTSATPCQQRSWTTVQSGDDGSNIELNSDLVFCNHSCRPSLVFDMGKFEVRVVDDRPLKAGDPLTFFCTYLLMFIVLRPASQGPSGQENLLRFSVYLLIWSPDPSTEWDMAGPFTCECSKDDGNQCGRRIAGAKYADSTLLKQYWLNDHIKHLLAAEGSKL